MQYVIVERIKDINMYNFIHVELLFNTKTRG